MVKLKLKSSYRIVDEKNRIVMAKGRMEILESIQETGSINQTAKQMKMSYKTVWSKLRSTEKHLQKKIVRTDRKHGTELTRDGKALLEQYKKMQAECIRSDDRIFKRIFN